MSKTKKQFTVNTASGFAAQLSLVVVGFIMMPYAIGRLGKEGYGIYQLAQSALVFFSFLQVGMAPTLIRFCSQAIALKDTEQTRKIISTAQLILGCLGILGLVICVLLVPLFIRFYDIPSYLVWETTGLLICVGVSLFLNMMCIVPQGVAFGSNRYDLVNGIEIVNNILRLILVVAAFELIRPSIFLLGISILITQLFRFLALFTIGTLNVGRRSMLFSFCQVDSKLVRSMLQFSILTFTNTVAYEISAQAPVLIIGRVYGMAAVTYFAPAILVSDGIRGFISQLSRPLIPLASRDHATNKGVNLGKWSTYVSQLTCCFGLACTLPFCVFGHEIMQLWVGSDLAAGWYIVAIMAFGALLSQTQSANLNLAIGSASIKPFVYSQVILAAVLVIGITIGAIVFRWYFLGIVLFIIVCRGVRNIGYLSYVGSKLFSYGYLKYLKAVYIEPIVAFIITIGAGYVVRNFYRSLNIAVLSIEVGLLLAVYALICWKFVLEIETRESIKGLLTRAST